MANVQKVHRIRATDLATGTKIEKSEHPWAGKETAKRIAKDHLAEDPNYYGGGSEGNAKSVVILNQNVKATTPRKKKAPPKQQVQGGPSWIPNNLRFYG